LAHQPRACRAAVHPHPPAQHQTPPVQRMRHPLLDDRPRDCWRPKAGPAVLATTSGPKTSKHGALRGTRRQHRRPDFPAHLDAAHTLPTTAGTRIQAPQPISSTIATGHSASESPPPQRHIPRRRTPAVYSGVVRATHTGAGIAVAAHPSARRTPARSGAAPAKRPTAAPWGRLAPSLTADYHAINPFDMICCDTCVSVTVQSLDGRFSPSAGWRCWKAAPHRTSLGGRTHPRRNFPVTPIQPRRPARPRHHRAPRPVGRRNTRCPARDHAWH
jgi:hypothetical protein